MPGGPFTNSNQRVIIVRKCLDHFSFDGAPVASQNVACDLTEPVVNKFRAELSNMLDVNIMVQGS